MHSAYRFLKEWMIVKRSLTSMTCSSENGVSGGVRGRSAVVWGIVEMG
jgi:hypothetical protein